MRIEIFLQDSQLSFGDLFDLLENSADFACWFGETLAGFDFEAFFWEMPPLTTGTLGNDAEFVIIDSVPLSRLRADPVPFASQFALQHGSDVITFPNLGGDALLIVPIQIGSVDSYPHLATFLRTAPGSQVSSLWQVAARVVRESLSAAPRWLSTAGLGVSWLHLRLDTHPKYYSFSPYKTAP